MSIALDSNLPLRVTVSTSIGFAMMCVGMFMGAGPRTGSICCRRSNTPSDRLRWRLRPPRAAEYDLAPSEMAAHGAE